MRRRDILGLMIGAPIAAVLPPATATEPLLTSPPDLVPPPPPEPEPEDVSLLREFSGGDPDIEDVILLGWFDQDDRPRRRRRW